MSTGTMAPVLVAVKLIFLEPYLMSPCGHRYFLNPDCTFW